MLVYAYYITHINIKHKITGSKINKILLLKCIRKSHKLHKEWHGSEDGKYYCNYLDFGFFPLFIYEISENKGYNKKYIENIKTIFKGK